MVINRKTLLLLILITLPVAYLTYTNIFNKPSNQTGTMMGNILLDETFQNTQETGNITFSNYRGKVLVIDFLAPWCNPCKEQVKVLKEVALVKGVEVISINIDSSYDMKSLRTFAGDEGITWLFGHSPRAGIDYQVTAIPTIIISDGEGLIVYRGFYTTKETILSKVLK